MLSLLLRGGRAKKKKKVVAREHPGTGLGEGRVKREINDKPRELRVGGDVVVN
jgi:hypothetical protein